LNVAQNKIEKLPPSGDRAAIMSPTRKLKTGRGTTIPERLGYTAPVLEEVYLQVCQISTQRNCMVSVPSIVLYSVSIFHFETWLCSQV